jgi:hypothetical protein
MQFLTFSSFHGTAEGPKTRLVLKTLLSHILQNITSTSWKQNKREAKSLTTPQKKLHFARLQWQGGEIIMNIPLHFNERDQLSQSSEEESKVSPPSMRQSELEEDSKQSDTKKRRKVRFQGGNEAEVLYPIRGWSNLSFEQKTDMWWQPDDYIMMKNTAKAVAGTIRDGGVYNQSRLDYAQVIHRVYFSHINQINPGRIETEMFKLWIAAGHSRRGLESWSVPGLFQERQTRKQGICKQVLKAYKDAEAMGSDLESRHEFVRAVYERISAPGKLLALDFGTADEFAAKRENVVGNVPTIEQELRGVLPPELLREILPSLGRCRSSRALLQRPPPEARGGRR